MKIDILHEIAVISMMEEDVVIKEDVISITVFSLMSLNEVVIRDDMNRVHELETITGPRNGTRILSYG